MSTHHQPTDRGDQDDRDDDRDDWQERYEQLVETIDAQTGSPTSPNDQPAAARRSSISVALHHANFEGHTIAALYDRALRNDDIARVRDPAGRECYALATVPALRAVVAELNADPDRYDVDVETIAGWIGDLDEDG